MLNILIPMSGDNTFPGAEFAYPKPLIEIAGKPMIEHVIACLNTIQEPKRFIFIANAKDCLQFHLDSVLKLVGGDESVIIQLEKGTKGAACSCLMAIDHISGNDPLLISNSDHIILSDLNLGLASFRKEKLHAGVFSFDAVHPKWSYVRLDETGRVVETAEKRPLSRHAIAGLYYFAAGNYFVEAAMRSIQKDAHINNLFYISPVLNEMILDAREIGISTIENSKYFNFYSPQKIREYEDYLHTAR